MLAHIAVMSLMMPHKSCKYNKYHFNVFHFVIMRAERLGLPVKELSSLLELNPPLSSFTFPVRRLTVFFRA